MDGFALLLIAICVVLVCLPPRLDPAIRLKEWLLRPRDCDKRIRDQAAQPSCYGTYPFHLPHVFAENGCGDCPLAMDCYNRSFDPRLGR